MRSASSTFGDSRQAVKLIAGRLTRLNDLYGNGEVVNVDDVTLTWAAPFDNR